MSAIQPLCYLIGISPSKLSKEENLILEAELFICICNALKEHHRAEHKNYFRSIKLTIEMEEVMLETNFVRLIIRDILLTEEYTLDGIAHYTGTHKDIVDEIFAGHNTSPSATFLRKLIELHRSVRHELYNMIIKKSLHNI